MFVTPGVIVDGKLLTNNLVDINLGIRILLGSSYYEDWAENGSGEMFVRKDPLGNPVDKRHPWNQTTIPRPQKRDFGDKYTWVMSPRWFDKNTGDHLALDTGGGPIAQLLVHGAVRFSGCGLCESTWRRIGSHSVTEDDDQTRAGIRLAHSKMEQRHRTQSRSHLFPSLRRRSRNVLRGEGDG